MPQRNLFMKPKKQKPECEKCGNTTNIHTRYDKSDYDCTWSCRAKEEKEHLHYYCRNCSYDWIGPVKSVAAFLEKTQQI